MNAAIPLALLAFALAALPASAEIYKWKDKDGKLHFSDIPPTGVHAKPVGKTPAPPPAAEPATARPKDPGAGSAS